jgi:hypothetical protein
MGKGNGMSVKLSMESVEHDGGIVVRARKGSGVAHYVKTCPVVMGSFDVDKLCGGVLGSTSDASIELGTDVAGALCKRCESMYGRMLDAQRVAEESHVAEDVDAVDVAVPATGEVSVPGDVSASTPGNTDRVQAALDAARKRVAEESADVPVMDCGADAGEVSVSARESVRELDRESVKRLSPDKPSANAQRDTLRDAADGTAGRREGQAREWARITDGKCAVVVTAEDGEEITVSLSGRMDMVAAVAVAKRIGHVDAAGEPLLIPVGKSAAALAPLALGGVEDGIQGVCPVCHRVAGLTNSGGIGTHRPSGETPSAPKFPSKEIPAVDGKGEPTRDAAKRRDREAYREEIRVTLDPMAPVEDQVAAVLAAVRGDVDAAGVESVRVAVVERAERRGTSGLMGQRNHGRGDGVAMTPRGESGYAGWTFDKGETVIMENGTVRQERVKAPTSPEEMAGGKYGTRTVEEYNAMSPRARKRYRSAVNNRAKAASAARAERKAAQTAAAVKRETVAAHKALGSVVSAIVAAGSGTAPRKSRKSVAIGSAAEGTVSHRNAHFTHTDVAVVKVASA